MLLPLHYLLSALRLGLQSRNILGETMSDLPEAPSTALSRRAMMRKFGIGAGGVALFATTLSGNRGAVAQTKMAQKVVAYQDTPQGDHRCDNCLQFQPPSSCKIVDGTINPAGWCKVYVKKPA
jgi:hypothetical protein